MKTNTPLSLRSLGLAQLVKRPIQTALHRAGYALVPRDVAAEDRLRRLLRRRGIVSVLDVGANQGQFARSIRNLGFDGEIHSFEPGRSAYALLERSAREDRSWHTYPLALGSEAAEVPINISHNSVSSSLLEVGERHLTAAPDSATKHTEVARVARLDEVMRGLVGPAWLKVDTQGYEMEVLAGTTGVLDHIDLVQVELSFTSLYHGQATYQDVLAFLASADFVVEDVTPGFRDPGTGRLLQADLLSSRQRENV